MFKNFLRSFRSMADMFRPPFDGLWLLFTLYFAWSFLVYPHSTVLRGELPDTDDYMYLDQMLDWLKGQGWYDNIQHRLDPPNGVPIHFSRLAMLPMAAITLMFEALGLGPKGSATLMAMIYPVILFGGLFAALRWTAESFMPKRWAGITAFVGFFATHTIFLFQPGHVDHHNLITILVALALGGTCRMIEQPDRHRWAVFTGAIMAFGLTVALEILPWLLLLSSCIGIWSAAKGGNAARSGLLYSLSLFIGSALCLTVTRLPSDLMTLDVLTYSAVYVILAGGVAVAFAGVYLAARLPLAARLVAGAVLAAVAGGAFLHRFPEMMGGPYGGIDPEISRIILDEIIEAQPMKDPDTGWLGLFWISGSAFLAVPLGVYYFIRARGTQRWLWGCLNVVLLASFGLTVFYQRRYAGTMNMLEIFPLAVLFYRGWVWIGERYRGRRQFFAELGLILLTGPLLPILLPSLADGRSVNTGVFLFAVSPASPSQEACEAYELENALRNPIGLGSKPHVILNTISEGPEILFRTPHSILAAPFHMDVEGNIDAARFLSTPYPEEAESIARRRHIDLIVSCMFAANFYFHVHPWDKNDDQSGPGKDFAPHFIERLLTGHIPPWLKPVKVPGLNNFVIYEVLPPVENKVESGPK